MVPPRPNLARQEVGIGVTELRVKLFSGPSALNTFQVDGHAEALEV